MLFMQVTGFWDVWFFQLPCGLLMVMDYLNISNLYFKYLFVLEEQVVGLLSLNVINIVMVYLFLLVKSLSWQAAVAS